jgi:hypothetical protein
MGSKKSFLELRRSQKRQNEDGDQIPSIFVLGFRESIGWNSNFCSNFANSSANPLIFEQAT